MPVIHRSFVPQERCAPAVRNSMIACHAQIGQSGIKLLVIRNWSHQQSQSKLVTCREILVFRRTTFSNNSYEFIYEYIYIFVYMYICIYVYIYI